MHPFIGELGRTCFRHATGAFVKWDLKVSFERRVLFIIELAGGAPMSGGIAFELGRLNLGKIISRNGAVIPVRPRLFRRYPL